MHILVQEINKTGRLIPFLCHFVLKTLHYVNISSKLLLIFYFSLFFLAKRRCNNWRFAVSIPWSSIDCR